MINFSLFNIYIWNTMNAKMYKQNLLNNLYKPYQQCTACPLGSLGRTHVVFGEGNPDATLMLIGEGPGKAENEQGKPFVGKSGQLLNRVLELAEIKRSNVFITNIVKCRPPNNRKPLPLEINTCKKILLFNQIKIIQPKTICTLGSAAIQGLLEKNVKITKLRGTVLQINSINIIPTFHPAYVLRNPKELQVLLNDLKKALVYSLRS